MHSNKKIFALDFDGVICDGLAEYFETTKQTYQLIWKTNQKENLEKFREDFYQLRPVIETGWEMPVLLRALTLGIGKENILKNWIEIVNQIIKNEQLSSQTIGEKLDRIRDSWIKNDLTNWLRLHQIYPGIKDNLTEIIKTNVNLYIVSTKEGRFIKEILKQQEIEISQNNIIGKECKRPKHESLRVILRENQEKPENLIFIEDRIEPLETIYQQQDLRGTKLYLASWGYNTETTRNKAKKLGYINILNLEDLKLSNL
jgi:phosphoglycolate phosphatase-like HAD superfamily hydrolase